MKKVLTLTSFVVAASSVAAPAIASARGGDTVEFSYSSSELDTRQGRLSLMDRLERTAQRSCKSNSLLVSRDFSRNCAKEVMTEVIAKIGDVRLAADLPGSDRTDLAMRSVDR